MKKSGNVLVTGGAGFVGSHLVDRFISEGYKVKIVDNLSSGRLDNIAHNKHNPNFELIVGDLKKEEDALEALKDINVVFHFAANPEVRVSTTNPEIHYNDNIYATFNLLESARRNDVDQIVYASSSSVYGEPGKIPVLEDSPIQPVSVYGATKAACEALMHSYSLLYQIKITALRYANIIGPRLRHGVIYDFMMKLLKDSKKLEILGDGTQTRSYIYIDDAIEATIIAWKTSTGHFAALNVGSKDWITVREIADITTRQLKLAGVEYLFKPALNGIGWLGDVKRIALSIDKIEKLGFNPKLDSRAAIQKTVVMLKDELQM